MPHFMPIQQDKADALNERLSKTVFKNYNQFVEAYNEGFINVKNDKVVELVQNITEIFKNVTHENGKLVFISENEVLLSEILVGLGPWTSIIKVKRELNNLIEADELNEDETIVFTSNGIGFIYAEKTKEDGSKVFAKVGTEKHFKRQAEVLELFNDISSYAGEDLDSDEEYYFKVSDFTRADDSFIREIHSYIKD